MNFEILNQDAKKVNCDVVDLFADKNNNINYIIYTDGTKNEEGELEVYASRYIKKNDFFVLEDIKEEYEWDLIDEFLLKKDK